MSLASWLTSTASLERATGGVDSMGAPKSTSFAAVTGKNSLACAIWPNGSGPFAGFAQFSIKGNYALAFDADTTARAGDRFTIGSTHYLVQALQTFSSPVVSGETLYLVGADIWP